MISSVLKSNKVAIFRALQLGDMMCAIPAIRAFKIAKPDVHITLIGLPGFKEFTLRFKQYFDDFIPFPGYPGLPEQNFDQEKYDSFLKNVQFLNFDLILQMQGNGTIVNEMIKSFGARFIAGFCPESSFRITNEFFMPYPNYGHEIERHLLLMQYLGIPSKGIDLEFPLHEQDYKDLEHFNFTLKPNKYVCIHPGSRGSWRQWPPLYFASIGDYCLKMDYEVVITGTKEEIKIAENVAGLMKGKPIIACGKTSIGAVGVIISQAYALIANCTGVSHMAAALKTQSVIISMDGEPERWAPTDVQLHRTIDWTKTPDYQLVFKELTSLFFRL